MNISLRTATLNAVALSLLMGCFDNTSTSSAIPDKPTDPVIPEEVVLTDIRFAKDEHTLLLDESRSLVNVPEQMMAVYSDGAEKTFAEAGIDAATLQWTTDNDGVFSYDEAAHTITGMSEGQAIIGATYDGKSTQTKLNVIDEFQSIELDASASKLVVGGAPVKVSAIATGRRGVRTPVGSETGVKFTASPNASWDDNTMTLKATEAGTVTLSASYTPVRGEVVNTPSPLTLIAEAAPTVSDKGSVTIVSPGATRVIAGTQRQLDVTLVGDDGKAISDASLVTWDACDGTYVEGEPWECKLSTIATVSESGLVVFIAGQSGTVTIRASYGGKASHVTFTVDAPALTQVATTKSSSLAMLPGQQVSLTTFATYEGGRTEDITSVATYAVSPAGVVAVDGGKVTALAAGAATITPNFAGLSGNPVSVDVTAVTASSVTASAASEIASSFIVDSTGTVTVMAQMTDGSIRDVTELVRWKAKATADGNLVTINGNTAKALAAGTATWVATYSDLSAELSFNVIESALAYIDFTANSRADNTHTLNKGAELLFSFIASYENGKQIPIDAADVTLSWVPDASELGSSGAITTTINADGKLLIGYGATGKGVLTATYKGLTTDITITLEAEKALKHVTIAPSATNVNAGKTLQFKAAAVYDDNSTQQLDASQVGWSVDNPEIAVISADGVLTALTKGSVTVSANYNTNETDYPSPGVPIKVSDAVVESIYLNSVNISGINTSSPTSLTLIPNEFAMVNVRARMSDGTTAAVPFDDVAMFDTAGIMRKYRYVNVSWDAIYPQAAGNTTLTLSYDGVSLDVPVDVADVAYDELFIHCSSATTAASMTNNSGTRVVNLDGESYGICSLAAKVDARIYLLTPSGGVDGGHPAVTITNEGFYTLYGFDATVKSGMGLGEGDRITLTACLYDGRCAHHEMEVANNSFSFGYVWQCGSNKDGHTYYTKQGRPRYLSIPILKQGLCIWEFDRTDIVSPAEMGYTIGSGGNITFVPLRAGEADVTITARVSNDVDQESSTTFKVVTLEKGDYYTSGLASIDVNAGESSWALPALIHDKIGPDYNNITSTVTFESQDADFVVEGNTLHFNGTTLPDSVTLNVASAVAPNEDVVDTIKTVTIKLIDMATIGDQELPKACSDAGQFGCITVEAGVTEERFAFPLDNSFQPFFAHYLNTVEVGEDGLATLGGFNPTTVGYGAGASFVDAAKASIYQGFVVDTEGASAVCAMLNARVFDGRTNWVLPSAPDFHNRLNNSSLPLGTAIAPYLNASNGALTFHNAPLGAYKANYTHHNGSKWLTGASNTTSDLEVLRNSACYSPSS